MNAIESQISRTKRPSDSGLLERVENGRNPSKRAVLALISRTADVLDKNDWLNECLEDETYVAFDALDKLRGKLSDCIDEDDTGVTEVKRHEDAIKQRHDYNRKSEAA
ncbi:hypothetical protein NQF87_00070 [Bombella sp. TMW 2.2559]|uniref:XRE family transcriptional regulator n=1 Tax=Bombella dulcis TaxID=2967339 RepID=A0ABT3W8I3_9PROT|nr:hypothetical protein [Bombella dulcis]MCX5615380.1 hypothetical protein [Bombella dulcis]